MILPMIGAFTYRGISSLAYNLICQSVTRPLIPPLKSNIVKIPGSSDIYDAGGANYDLMNITLKIQYIGDDYYELRTRAIEIANWLGGDIWGKLLIEGQDGYYVAKIESEIDLQSVVGTPLGVADIEFLTLPFIWGASINGALTKTSNYSGGSFLNYDSR